MMSGRSVLGVVAGVLLGLGIVALASSGISPYGMRAASPTPTLYTTNGTSTQSVTTTNTFGASVAPRGSNTTFGVDVGQISSTGQKGQTNLASSAGAAAPLSQVKSIARQPITLTGFVLLPIFAALLFGFVLYRVSRVRNEREEPPEAF